MIQRETRRGNCLREERVEKGSRWIVSGWNIVPSRSHGLAEDFLSLSLSLSHSLTLTHSLSSAKAETTCTEKTVQKRWNELTLHQKGEHDDKNVVIDPQILLAQRDNNTDRREAR